MMTDEIDIVSRYRPTVVMPTVQEADVVRHHVMQAITIQGLPTRASALRRPVFRRRRLALVGMVALATTGGAVAAVTVLTGGSMDHGTLRLAEPIHQRMAELNGALDSCYLSNGAKRVSAGRGWTYLDPSGRASAACAVEQKGVNEFADSPMVRQAQAVAAPVLARYWSCMTKTIPELAVATTVIDVNSPVVRDAEERCSATANGR